MLKNSLSLTKAETKKLLKSEEGDAVKLATVREFDIAILGLDLDREEVTEPLPQEILDLMALRIKARSDKDWAESDRIRDEIQAMGYTVQDGKEGMQVLKK